MLFILKLQQEVFGMKRQSGILFCLMLQAAVYAQPSDFSFNDVIAQARSNASVPYQKISVQQQSAFSQLTYDQYRNIRFDSSKAVWAASDSPFRLDVFPAGFLFTTPVRIFLIEKGTASEFHADEDMFINDSGKKLSGSSRIPLSGFRIRNQLNERGVWDEFLVFQGASYFRAASRNSSYGLSARGLYIQPENGKPEEFPVFTSFWIRKPDAGDTSLVIYALMDSDSVTGAYQFTVTPGDATAVQVQAVVFARRDIQGIGVAPLTSMFYFDESNRSFADDFRSGSHDSDGFYAVLKSGEVIWRQLMNPEQVSYASFTSETPQLFGLLQRARTADAYEDFEAQYEKRPSAWVVPGDDWPEGSADLIEIPSDRDTDDNIVAFWKVKANISKEKSAAFNYTLYFSQKEEPRKLAVVSGTRSGSPAYGKKSYRVYAVDFSDEAGVLPADLNDIGIDVQTSDGVISGAHLEQNPVTGGVRLAFELHPGKTGGAELRVRLTYKGKPVSETWLYRWSERR